MPATTTKGVPYPVAGDNNNVPADIQALANWVDTSPGIRVLTTAARDALSAVDKWDGRIVHNTTSGRLERYNTTGAVWTSATELQPTFTKVNITSAAADIALTITGGAGQTADFLDVRTSGNVQQAAIDPGGGIFGKNGYFGGRAAYSAQLNSTAMAAGTRALALKAAAGQTADILTVINSSDVGLTSIQSNGHIWSGAGADLGADSQLRTTATVSRTFSVGVGGTGGPIRIAFVGTPGAWFTDAVAGDGALRHDGVTQTLRLGVGSGASQVRINSAGMSIAGNVVTTNGVGAVRSRYHTSEGDTGTYLDFSGTVLTALQRTAASTVFVVRGAASQTANLEEWQNSAGAVLAKVTSNGAVRSVAVANSTFGTDTNDADAIVTVATGVATAHGIVVRGAASQTANLQEWQDSANTVLSSMNSGGQLNAQALGSNGATFRRVLDIYNARGIVGGTTIPAASATLAVVSMATTDVPLLVQGIASQATDLQQWQNSTGGVLGGVGASGTLFSGAGTTAAIFEGGGTNHRIELGRSDTVASTPYIDLHSGATPVDYDSRFIASGGDGTSGGGTITAQVRSLYVEGSRAAGVPFYIRGASAQTANLQEWQAFGGAVKAHIGATGAIHTDNDLTTSAVGSTALGGAVYYGATLNVLARATGDRPIVARGLAGQTANLQEWQDGAGAANTYVRPAGGLVAPYGELRNSADATTLGYANYLSTPAAGVRPVVIRMAAAQTASAVEVQNSTGTVMANITPNGSLFLAQMLSAGGGLATTGGDTTLVQRTKLSGAGDYGASLNILAGTYGGVGAPGAVIRGAAGQTGNLQEWQNSAGTMKSRITSAGAVGGENGPALDGPSTQVRPAAGGGNTLPASPEGYLRFVINGIARSIPYYLDIV